MPAARIELSPDAAEALRAMPEGMRRRAGERILDLALEAVPAAAEPYAGIPGAHRLTTPEVIIYYVHSPGLVDIQVIRPNT